VRENLRFYGGVYGLRGQELRARMAGGHAGVPADRPGRCPGR
jgi:hypothetical protein